MITRKDIEEAIAECQGVRNPTAKTCIKLAAFLTIREYMFNDNRDSLTGYSGEQPRAVSAIGIDSDFLNAIAGKPETDVLEIMDDVMNSVKYFNPRLYADAIRRLKEL